MEIKIDIHTGMASINRAGNLTTVDGNTEEGKSAIALALQQLADIVSSELWTMLKPASKSKTEAKAELVTA